VERGAALDVRERQVFEWEQWVRGRGEAGRASVGRAARSLPRKCAEEPRHCEALWTRSTGTFDDKVT